MRITQCAVPHTRTTGPLTPSQGEDMKNQFESRVARASILSHFSLISFSLLVTLAQISTS